MIVNPVREALDYYRKLNEASRRNLEQPASPINDNGSPSTDESSGPIRSEQQQTTHPDPDERKTLEQQPEQQQMVGGFHPTTPISRERYVIDYPNSRRSLEKKSCPNTD